MTIEQPEGPGHQRSGDWRPLHIAMIGQKGLPATVGGIEHHVEEIGRRLAARGHRVTVYCRRSYSNVADRSYLGMDLRLAPTVGTKHLDALVHSASTTALAIASGADIVHYHALGPGIMAPLPRYLSNAKVVLTVHGLDHQRQKWGHAAQTMMGASHWMSAHVPDRTIVVSQDLRRHYEHEMQRHCVYIPNGVDQPSELPSRIVEEMGLTPGRYALFVGRLVPEKCPDLLVRAFRDVPGDVRLVVVGDSSHTDRYAASVQRLAAADPRVLLPGYLYGDRVSALYRHAAVFVQPSVLEGLPLTLLEAAAHGCPIVASDIPPHLEVLGPRSHPGRRIFHIMDQQSLTECLADSFADVEHERRAAAELRAEVLTLYNWEAAIDQLEDSYLSLFAPRPQTVRRPLFRGWNRTQFPATTPVFANDEQAHTPASTVE